MRISSAVCLISILALIVIPDARSEKIEEDALVNDVMFPAGSYLQYDSGGALVIAVPSKDVRAQGIICGEGGTMVFYLTGQLKSASLRNEQEVQGILCASNRAGDSYDGGCVSLYSSGKLWKAVLARDQKICGISCAKNSTIVLGESGKVEEAVLAEPLEWRGVIFTKGSRIFFDKEGDPTRFVLGNEQVFSGIEFKKGTEVSINKSGMMDKARIAQVHQIFGNNYPEKTEIYFDMSGKVSHVELLRDQEIQGILCAAPGKVYFYKSGRIKDAEFIRAQNINGVWQKDYSSLHLYETGFPKMTVLEKPEAIQGVSYDTGTCIFYYDTGKPERIVLKEGRDINNIPCEKGCVSFYESGNVKSAVLSRDYVIKGIPCRKGEQVLLFKSGELQSAVISKDIVIQEKPFKAGTMVVFDESGMLDKDIINIQKETGQYDFAEIKYYDPKFAGNDKVVFLVEEKKSSKAGYGVSTLKMRIMEKNITNGKEDTLYIVDCDNDNKAKAIAYSDKKNFQVDTEGGIAFIETDHRDDVQEPTEIIKVDLKQKRISVVEMKGAKYRISPEGRSVIYADMDAGKSGLSTIYLCGMSEQPAVAIYETEDVVLDIFWVNKNIIAVLGVNSKGDRYIDVIDIIRKEIVDEIKNTIAVREFLNEHYSVSVSADAKFSARVDSGDIVLTDMKTRESWILKKGCRRPE